MYQGFCEVCNMHENLNDVLLCNNCNEKLERDLIRKGEYDYSSQSAFKSTEERKNIHKNIIKKYGSNMELLIENKKENKKKRDVPKINNSQEKQKINASNQTIHFKIIVERKNKKWFLIVNNEEIDSRSNLINLVFDFVYKKYEKYGDFAKFQFPKILLDSIKQSKGKNQKSLFINRIYKGKTHKIAHKNASK